MIANLSTCFATASQVWATKAEVWLGLVVGHTLSVGLDISSVKVLNLGQRLVFRLLAATEAKRHVKLTGGKLQWWRKAIGEAAVQTVVHGSWNWMLNVHCSQWRSVGGRRLTGCGGASFNHLRSATAVVDTFHSLLHIRVYQTTTGLYRFSPHTSIHKLVRL